MQKIDPIVRAVLNLLKTRGGPVSMVVNKAGVYNPETSSTDVVVKTFTPLALVQDAKVTLASQALVKEGDKQIFIRPDEGTPKPTPGETEFKIQGEYLRVYLVREVNPSGTDVIYYEVFARK